MQTKVGNLDINRKKTSLKINHRKTVVMKWKVNLGMKDQLEGSDSEEVEKFMLQSQQLMVQVKIQEPGWEKHKQSSAT